MANCNHLFLTFNNKITLTNTKEGKLKKGRDALREKISSYFIDQGMSKPKYHGQGSYSMKTIINPLEGNEYDIDDGIYLQGFSPTSKDDWPENYETHDWIYEAVAEHTSKNPEDKDTCIRVIYSDDYHIDLPCYILEDDEAFLSHRSEGWILSDPKAFTDWFIDEKQDKGEQLRRLVKYLKAWKDFKDIDLKGIACTILITNEFYKFDSRDDKALLGTITNIIEELEDDFKCIKPVSPNEDIFEEYGFINKMEIINGLEELKHAISEAVNSEDVEEASNYLIEQFGNRFPKGKPSPPDKNSKSESYVKTKGPGVLNNDGRSA